MFTMWLLLLLAVQSALAFPFMGTLPGIDKSLLARGYVHNDKRQTISLSCPVNPTHTAAAPYGTFTYSGARNGLPGTGIGGYKVPADGDTAHQFEAPGPNDIRGPCPALNTMANHHFLSHDGITTFSELCDAQQNAFNVNYDLAVILATLGVGLSGDPITTKLSIGCNANAQTADPVLKLLGANEQGLNGHNKIECDTSLTRNDYFLANGDNFSFNGTLFAMMASTCGGNFNQAGLALYRYQRYQQSLAANPAFYYPPLIIGVYGAATFLYRSLAGSPNTPDLATISSFFGAQADGNGGYTFNNRETFPANWYAPTSPYSFPEAVGEIVAMYAAHPILLGGNAGAGNFVPLTLTGSGTLPVINGVFNATPQNVICLLYQIATNFVPNSLDLPLTITNDIVNFISGKLNALSSFQNMGCPFNIT